MSFIYFTVPILNDDYVYSVLTDDFESENIIAAYNNDVANNFTSTKFKRGVAFFAKRIINLEFKNGRHE